MTSSAKAFVSVIALAGAAVLVGLCGPVATAASVGTSLRPPTGYRDYCERQKGAPCPRGGVPASVWRPLVLPSAHNGTCAANAPVKRFASTGAVIGHNPVFFNLGNSASVLSVDDPPPPRFGASGTPWRVGILKIALSPTFKGPYVLRGGRIDQAGEAGFTGLHGTRPFAALQVPPRVRASRGQDLIWSGARIWLADPGCYAIQVDGVSFSFTIVFEVDFRVGQ